MAPGVFSSNFVGFILYAWNDPDISNEKIFVGTAYSSNRWGTGCLINFYVSTYLLSWLTRILVLKSSIIFSSYFLDLVFDFLNYSYNFLNFSTIFFLKYFLFLTDFFMGS